METNPQPSPSAIIIGGGPAGSVAAVLLARANFSVDLFEQHAFPRDKVCGECLSGVGIDVLSRSGVVHLLDQISPAKLIRTLLHPADGPSIEVALPRPSMGISRVRMDQILLTAAADAGAVVHQPARCESVTPGQNPSVTWRDLSTNACREISADWIIIADGKGSLLPGTRRSTGDLGIKTHFENLTGPADAIELFAGDGLYGGLAAIENRRWNAAFSVPASLVKQHAGDLQGVFDHAVRGSRALQERLAGARRISSWLASPLPRFAVGRNWPRHVVPIGNAAAALEPVGGEGMGLALRSAELAADAIIASQSTGSESSVNDLPREFQKLWEIRRTVCRGIALMFSRPDLADAVAPLISANLNIPTAMMRWAGKSDRNRP